MLLILGSGPGAAHYISLCTVSFLEICNVALVESLVNRSLLNILSSDCRLKYVGRPLHGANVSFYGVLFSLIWLNHKRVNLAWLKNGDALIYNRGLSVSVFFSALNIKHSVVCAPTAALAALSIINIAATSIRKSGVIFDLNVRYYSRYSLMAQTLMVYMARLNALAMFDSLICDGLNSASVVVFVCSVSLCSQTAICASLNALVFFLTVLSFNSSGLLIIGDSVNYSVDANWLKSTINANSVFD
ncbi:SAM-dependent methyltransferase [Candidatus Hodgkinia cicadicola]